MEPVSAFRDHCERQPALKRHLRIRRASSVRLPGPGQLFSGYGRRTPPDRYGDGPPAGGAGVTELAMIAFIEDRAACLW